jgi:formylglycine-generating enzyme required for sulfatase activity
MPHRKYFTPQVLHDAPLHDRNSADFYFDDFAATLARLVANPGTETPLAIGINGSWGSGKTSLLLRVKHMLDQPNGVDGKGDHRFGDPSELKSFRKCKTVWFDAWKYNEEDELLVALVRVILQAMKKDGLMDRLNAWLEDPNPSSYDLVAMFINSFEFSFGGLGLGVKFKADPQKHEAPSKFEQHTAFFDYFNEAFERLLALWVHNKGKVEEINERKGALVIFIDDLDRCLPDKIVQALEALKLFLDKQGCVFVIGADISIIQRAVAKYYADAGITGESARDYLEKVIQLRFDLPPIVEKAMQAYLQSQDKIKVDEAMLQRWQALVAAAEVNPRRVKNVINDLNLQWFMAVNSGQAEDVNRDDFICWQALMRAAPRNFVDHVLGTLEDSERRHSFIMDALKWQQGSQEDRELVKGYFSAYEDKDAKRLRGVLKQISFSVGFTPDTLESMIYMTAPPAVAKAETLTPPVEESKSESQVQDGTKNVDFVEAERPGFLRREAGTARGDGSRLTIGGIDFMRVPAGKFVMGSKEGGEFDYEWERPQHTIDLPYDFWMGKFILTNKLYSEFLGQKKHPVDGWQNKRDRPVLNVSWEDVMAYCKWFNETFKSELGDLLLRLPTEAEWEKAARGAYGNEWPWGNEFEAGKCNSAEGPKGETTAVGSYSPGGDSPYGCADMVGNVWEWTHSLFAMYPYDPKDGREEEKSRDHRVVRGGSFRNNRNYARCASRGNYDPGARSYSLGFRVCVVPHHTSGI